MKKVILATIATTVLTTSAMAEGLVQELFSPSAEVSGIYIGVGMSDANIKIEGATSGDTATFETWTPSIQVGYQYNKYLAVEGRYIWNKIQSSLDNSTILSGDITTLKYAVSSLFLKPQYTFRNFTGYALIGAGQMYVRSDRLGNDNSDISFQYGLGLEYALSEGTGIYVDYTNLFDAKGNNLLGAGATDDLNAKSFNFGMKYKF